MARDDIIQIIDCITQYQCKDWYERESTRESILRHIDSRGLDDWLRSTTLGKGSEVENYIRDRVKDHCWEKAARLYAAFNSGVTRSVNY
jgi:hypothetical protein